MLFLKIMAMINVIIADDYASMLQTLIRVINDLKGYKIVGVARNGYELLLCLNQLKLSPDIAIIDVNMPVIDGIQITKILNDHFVEIDVLGISLTNIPVFVADMLESGAKGFISKKNMDTYLEQALQTISEGGIFVEPEFEPELQKYLKNKQISVKEKDDFEFSQRELLYMQLNASELDYKAIAGTMHVSEKSVHNYHDSIKEKTGASSRLEQALFALKAGIAKTMRRNLLFEHK
jgi:DNA-binding NarL/FixJ family response regulator